MEYEKERGVKDNSKGFSLSCLGRWNEVEKTERNSLKARGAGIRSLAMDICSKCLIDFQMIVLFTSSLSLHIFCPLDLSYSENGVLKYY